ncbi:MAG: hypothetical protein Kow00105_14510 [Phycisphaeraceae bacterium]
MDIDRIHIDQDDDVAVLSLDVPMLTSLEADMLLDTLRAYHSQTGCAYFVIRMDDVDFIDSACIGSLVSFLIEIDKHQGKLMLAGCSDTITNMLKITGLTTHIPLLNNVKEAHQFKAA